MENGGSNFAALALPNSVGAQHRYPPHHLPLPHFSALLNQNQPEAVINIRISNISAEQERNTRSPTIVLDQSITFREDREEEEEGEGEELFDDDPSNLGMNDQQTTRLNVPNVAPYVLTMVLSLLVFIFFNLKQGKHTHIRIANPFVLISVVGSGIAYVAFSILSWVYDRADYKMLKALYYVGCNLAFISLLLILFTTT